MNVARTAVRDANAVSVMIKIALVLNGTLGANQGTELFVHES